MFCGVHVNQFELNKEFHLIRFLFWENHLYITWVSKPIRHLEQKFYKYFSGQRKLKLYSGEYEQNRDILIFQKNKYRSGNNI